MIRPANMDTVSAVTQPREIGHARCAWPAFVDESNAKAMTIGIGESPTDREGTVSRATSVLKPIDAAAPFGSIAGIN